MVCLDIFKLVFLTWIEHYSAGYLLESTLAWSEGRSEWQPLCSIPGLLTDVAEQSTGDTNSGEGFIT